MNKTRLEEILNTINVDGYSSANSLRKLCEIAGIPNKYGRKQELIKSLTEYYSRSEALKSIWDSIDAFEKDVVTHIIHCNGKPDYEELRELIKKHDPPSDNRGHYFYGMTGFFRYLAKDSKVYLLFPAGGIPDIFVEELKNIVPPFVIEYTVLDNPPKDCVIIERENRANDFERLVRFCNQNKVPVTGGGLMNKSSAVKLVEYAGYRELCEDGSNDPNEARIISQLKVTLPLFMLAVSGGLLTMTEGRALPDHNAGALITLPDHELIKSLYEAYMKTKSISEIEYMKGIKSSRKIIPWRYARQAVVKQLEVCPINCYIPFSEFERHIRLLDKQFIRPHTGYVMQVGQNGYECDWSQFERPLIMLILSFFGALGITDIAWETHEDDYGTFSQRVKAFRVTPLGAWILGVSDSYKPPKIKITSPEKGFIVQPNFDVLVPDGDTRTQHELYFERFLTKASDDAAVTIYHMDFESAVRALDMGLPIADVTKYLTDGASKPLPENVIQALSDWERQSGRIRLRRVTILETDDLYLLEELKRIKGMGEYITGDVGPSVAVNPGDTKKIKRLIEKHKRYCGEEL